MRPMGQDAVNPELAFTFRLSYGMNYSYQRNLVHA